MTSKSQKRLWWLSLIALLFLLPGFPLLIYGLVVTAAEFGWRHRVIEPAVHLHNLYYQIPARLFGEALFRQREFGPLSTMAGYIVAAVFYAVLAIGLSFPLTWLLGGHAKTGEVENDSPAP